MSKTANKVEPSKPELNSSSGRVPSLDKDFNLFRSLVLIPTSPLVCCKAIQLLKSLFGCSGAVIQIAINNFIIETIKCMDSIILKRISNTVFRIYVRHSYLVSEDETYNFKDFSSVANVVSEKIPMFINQTSNSSCIRQWTPLFSYTPDAIVAIPILSKSNDRVQAIVAVSFGRRTPNILMSEDEMLIFRKSLNLLIPYAMTVQELEDERVLSRKYTQVFDCLTFPSTTVDEIGGCAKRIADNMNEIARSETVIVFAATGEEQELRKFYTLGGRAVNTAKCPDQRCHTSKTLAGKGKTAVAWVAANMRGLRINTPADCSHYGLPTEFIHSVGGCIVRNMMVVPVVDYSGESPLIVEMSNRAGGFTCADEYKVLLFAQHIAGLLTTSILLDHRRKSIRRSDINNEVLTGSKTIHHTKVEELMTIHFSTRKNFKADFMNFSFSMKNLHHKESPGMVLHIFKELDMLTKWKMRRATLVRFIITLQMGYHDLPYHNWGHATNVTHFAFLMLKKVDLVAKGMLNDIEALSFIVACIAHDVDHRGTNNHFNLCTQSDLYHLYKTEDSLLERHHLAVTLAILSREDCNIVEGLSDEDYKEFVDLLSWNILATDIGKHMGCKDKYFSILEHFDKNNSEHRRTLLSCLMTMSDLSDNTKPWNDNIITVKCIFQEFFAQGDEELKLGIKPAAMMDRRIACIPDIEMKFLNNVVRPVYDVVSKLIPEVTECVTALDIAKELWLRGTQVFDKYVNSDPLLIMTKKKMKHEYLSSIHDRQFLMMWKERNASIPSQNGSAQSIKVASETTFQNTDAPSDEQKSLTVPEVPANLTKETSEANNTNQRGRKKKICLQTVFCCKSWKYSNDQMIINDSTPYERAQFEKHFMSVRSTNYVKNRMALYRNSLELLAPSNDYY